VEVLLPEAKGVGHCAHGVADDKTDPQQDLSGSQCSYIHILFWTAVQET